MSYTQKVKEKTVFIANDEPPKFTSKWKADTTFHKGDRLQLKAHVQGKYKNQTQVSFLQWTLMIMNFFAWASNVRVGLIRKKNNRQNIKESQVIIYHEETGVMPLHKTGFSTRNDHMVNIVH